MKTLLWNGTVIADGFKKIERGAVLIANRKIVDVMNYEESLSLLQQNDIEVIDVKQNYIMPGIIDIHIHGAVGRDFMEGGQEVIDAVSMNLVSNGCTGFTASLTVAEFSQLLGIMKSYSDVNDNENGAHFLGIHAEGPYISKKYKAVMDERYLSDPSIHELDEMILNSNNRVKIMTIAPESKGMMEFIKYGTNQNIKMMIGHSAADSKTATEALHQGAVGFTHLYNAMSQHLHREPGVVTAAFINKGAYVELIADGFHVDPEVVLMTYLNKGAESIVLITDAMLGKDMEDGDFTFSGLECRKEGLSVTVKETGRRAGSAVGIDHIIQTMSNITSCSANEIVQMACVNPANIAGVDKQKGTLEIGKDADLCIMDKTYHNLMTFVDGRLVYTKE